MDSSVIEGDPNVEEWGTPLLKRRPQSWLENPNIEERGSSVIWGTSVLKGYPSAVERTLVLSRPKVGWGAPMLEGKNPICRRYPRC